MEDQKENVGSERINGKRALFDCIKSKQNIRCKFCTAKLLKMARLQRGFVLSFHLGRGNMRGDVKIYFSKNARWQFPTLCHYSARDYF